MSMLRSRPGRKITGCNVFQFGGILLYKMGIWMFFIIPCIALYIIH